MRRARLHIKPNLGPRVAPGSRSQPAADTTISPKPKSAPAPSASQPSVTAADPKQDHFKILKPAESKSDSAIVSVKGSSHSDVSSAGHGSALRIKSPSVSIKIPSSSDTSSLGHGTALKSPSVADGVSDGGTQGGSADPGILSPSPRKAVGAEQKASGVGEKPESDTAEVVSPGKLMTASLFRARAVRTPLVTESASSEKQIKLPSRPVPPLSSPAKTPLLGARLQRSRFNKVKPNLAAAARHRSRNSESSDSVAVDVNVSSQEKTDNHSGNTPAEPDTGIEESVATAEDVQSEQDIQESGQPASATALTSTAVNRAAEGETNQEKDVPDGASEFSTPQYSESDVGEESVAGDTAFPFQADEKRKAEKKMRRPKTALPSSDAPVDRSAMKMMDLIYWNPNRNHMKKKGSQQARSPSHGSQSQERTSSLSADDEASNASDSLPVPQVKVGPDGNVILNSDSLVVENKPSDAMEQNSDIVEEDDDRFINCNSFRVNKKGKYWTKNETNRFYRALQQVGTDFSLMCSLFPSRCRRELKNKFRKEEKNNRARVDIALKDRQPFDKKTFELAKAEDEAENRRRNNTKVEKMKKKKKKKKKQSGEPWEDEGDEDEEEEEENDEDFAALDAMEEQERLENSLRKRDADRLLEDEENSSDSEFPSYKRKPASERKRMRKEQSSKQTKEVVDILVNMSQGKVPPRESDELSETSSIISEDGYMAEGQPFVPRVARQSTRSHHKPNRSSSNVIIDPPETLLVDATEPQLPPPVQSENSQTNFVANHVLMNQTAHTLPQQNQTSQLLLPPVQQTVSSQLTDPTQQVIPRGPAQHTPQGVATLTANATPQGVAGGAVTIPLNVMAVIEQLQASNSNMDVVLVEERSGNQDIVHVYVVPKAATEAAGSSQPPVAGSSQLPVAGPSRSAVFGQNQPQMAGQSPVVGQSYPVVGEPVSGTCS